MRIDIITGFPQILEEPLAQSIIGQGVKKGIAEIHLHNLRDFTFDRHRTIDDYPYGGGAGMVLKVEPIVLALESVFSGKDSDLARFILPSPRGGVFDQKTAIKFSLTDHLVFICGHFKGIDERLLDFYPVEEISIGDFVISSGEIAALVMIDALIRLLPGVISDIESAWTDSFNDELLDAPCYTRPEQFRGKSVPEVLLSGNHQKIEAWRLEKKEELTRIRRPDLYKKYKDLSL